MDDKANTLPAELPPDYGVEVMCANWNPVVAAVVEPLGHATAWLSEHAAPDADAFLNQFYRCQHS